ncbi:MAG: ribokinase [Acidobacteriota bacterium]
MSQTIVVVGSLNMDFVVQVDKLPLPGETLRGRSFDMLPGGKGANQACAVGRLGGRCRMVGRVGADSFGHQLRANLQTAGVDVSGVLTTANDATGVAFIFVERGGQNEIVIAPGANGYLRPNDVEAALAGVAGGYLLLQLESPLETVEAAAALGRHIGMKTVLDPAPARPLGPNLLRQVDVLTPNESEALQLLGGRAGQVSLSQAEEICRQLMSLGPHSVILKLGDKGAWLANGRQSLHFPARAVEAVDTTAAGDTFNGALAVALAEGKPIHEAIGFANLAASLSVTRAGAQTSIPVRDEVECLLN